jgi:hypothetical protein
VVVVAATKILGLLTTGDALHFWGKLWLGGGGVLLAQLILVLLVQLEGLLCCSAESVVLLSALCSLPYFCSRGWTFA